MSRMHIMVPIGVDAKAVLPGGETVHLPSGASSLPQDAKLHVRNEEMTSINHGRDGNAQSG